MHITKIEEFSFDHGQHFNTATGEYHSLNPHTLGRPLTHDEMDYNLIYQKQTLNGFRICGSNNDLTLALSDLGARLEFTQISSSDADWPRFQAAGLFNGQFVWNPVGGALPVTTTTTAAPTTTTTTTSTTTTTTAAPPATVIYHAHTNSSWVVPPENFSVTVAPIMTGSPYTIAGPTYSHSEGHVFSGWDTYSGAPMAAPQYQPGDQINLTPGSTTNLYARYDIPVYQDLTATPSPADEGQNIIINLSGINIPDGRTVGWTITGVDTNDISGSLTGTFTMNSNQAEYIITVTEDLVTEGTETLTLTCDTDDNAGTDCGLSVAIDINDTSLTPTTTTTVAPTYTLTINAVTNPSNIDGTHPLVQSGLSAGNFTLPSPTWSVTGYTFLGYDTYSGTPMAPPTLQPGDVINITADVNLYARYEEVVCSSDGTITLTNVSRASDGTITGTINVNMTTWDTTNSDVPGNVHVDIIGTGNGATDVDASAYGVFPAADVASNPTSTFTIQDGAWADGQGGSVSVQATLYLCSDVQQQITTTVNVSNNPTYSLSVNGPVNEGGNMVFTLTTTDLNDGDVVPFGLSGTATIGVDYSDVNPKEFVITNNSATYTVTTFADNTTEGGGNETIKLTLAAFDSQGNGTFSENVTGEIVDTSQTPTTTTTTSTTTSTTTTTTAAPTYTANTLFNHSAAATNHEMQTPLGTDVGTSHTISNSGLAAGSTMSHTVYLVADAGWEFDYSGLQVMLGGSPIDLNNQPAGVTITNPSPTQIRIQRDYVNIQSNVSSTMNINDVPMTAITTTTVAPLDKIHWLHWSSNAGYPSGSSLIVEPAGGWYLNNNTQTSDFDLIWADMVANQGTANNVPVIEEYTPSGNTLTQSSIPNGTIGFDAIGAANRYYIAIPQSFSGDPSSTALFQLPDSANADITFSGRMSFNINGVAYWLYDVGLTASVDALNLNLKNA